MSDPVNKNPIKTELLAPAGSKESFYAALKAGADAVYMSAEKFGARAYAGNFSYDDIFECSKFAHLYGKKIYLTVNTLVKEDEFDELRSFLDSGVTDAADGLIIQDLGVASFISRYKPEAVLHASTQMSVTGPEGAGILKEHGFSRVVPARELLFDEIESIGKETGLEIECFIHGAMCYSYSGQCLFSSVLGGRSGNRGRCAQPCRLPYRLKGLGTDKETYPLSLKDMCTLELLPKLISSGVCSLKVEGRMKPPEYVAGVISIYRKYLDLLESGKEYVIDKGDLKALSNLYVRDSLSHGYLDRHNSRDMVTVYSHGYNPSDDAFVSRITEKYITPANTEHIPEISLSFDARFKTGEPAFLSVSAFLPDGTVLTGSAKGSIAEKAVKSAIGREDIVKQFKKLGNTPYTTDEDLINTEIDDDCFYSLKGLNELRRAAISDLEKQLESDKRKIGPGEKHSSGQKNEDVHEEQSVLSGYKTDPFDPYGLSVLVSNADQLSALLECIRTGKAGRTDTVYLEEDMLLSGDISDAVNELKDHASVYLACSRIRRKRIPDIITGLLEKKAADGVLVRNLEDLGFFASESRGYKIITDHSLYAYNKEAAAFLDEYSDLHTLPLELSGAEILRLLRSSGKNFERVVYGRVPLMVTAGCVRKTLKQCSKNGGYETIIDRKGISFPVKCECAECLNIIYNSVPLLLKRDMDSCRMRIEFTNEDKQTVTDVTGYYNGVSGMPDIEYTTGWQSRPVQ